MVGVMKFRGTWKNRRRVIFGTLIYCGGAIGYLIFGGEDNSLNAAIATGLILLAGSVIGSYVFGAVWDDKSYRVDDEGD